MIQSRLNLGVDFLGSLIDAELHSDAFGKQLLIKNAVSDEGMNSGIKLSLVGNQLIKDLKKLARLIGLDDADIPTPDLNLPEEVIQDIDKLELQLKKAYLHLKKTPDSNLDIHYAFRARIIGGDQIDFGIKLHYIDLSIWNTENDKILNEIGDQLHVENE